MRLSKGVHPNKTCFYFNGVMLISVGFNGVLLMCADMCI